MRRGPQRARQGIVPRHQQGKRVPIPRPRRPYQRGVIRVAAVLVRCHLLYCPSAI